MGFSLRMYLLFVCLALLLVLYFGCSDAKPVKPARSARRLDEDNNDFLDGSDQDENDERGEAERKTHLPPSRRNCAGRIAQGGLGGKAVGGNS